jgi:putative ABC transport system permease protein
MRFGLFFLALKTLRRKPARTAAMVAGIACVSGTLFVLSLLSVSVNRSIEAAGGRLGADAMVVPAGVRMDGGGLLLSSIPAALSMEASLKERIVAMADVEAAASQLFIVSARLACCTVADTVLIGFEPGEDFTITPWLREKLRGPLAEDEIIVGTDILAEPGGRMKFYGKVFRISGKLEPTGLEFPDSAVFIPMEGARAMIEGSPEAAERPLSMGRGEISAVFLRFREGVDHERAAIAIEYALPEVQVILSSKALQSARSRLELPLKTMAAAGLVQWALSLVFIGVLYGLSVSEREREIGIMRALGARRGTILRLLMHEVLVLSSSGGLAGVLAGAGVLYFFQGFVSSVSQGAFLAPPLPSMILLAAASFACALLSGAAATWYPVFKGMRRAPFESIMKD